jgi:hypothetical protein
MEPAVALWICSMVTTIAGAFVGGWLAGYLPGNKNLMIGAVHGGLAWALAFIVMSAVGFAALGSMARTATEATMTAAGATAQTAGATVGGGEVTLDRKARDVLLSLGYTPEQADAMINEGKGAIQRQLHGGPQGPAPNDVRAVADDSVHWAAALTWSWFGTWLLAAIAAIAGGLVSVSQLRPRVKRPDQPARAEPPAAAPSQLPT